MRARDLNILNILEDLTGKIEKDFYDHILYSVSDENLMFYDDTATLEKTNSIVTSHGLWLMVYQGFLRLDEINRFLKKPKFETRHVYSPLPTSISPPVCEICQMAEGTKSWPIDYFSQFGVAPDLAGEGTEYLCETCFSVRSRPSKLRQLKTWTESEGPEVLWVKIGLNYELLTSTFQELYLNYLKKVNPSARPEDAEIRLSLISEFYKDYDLFLISLQESLLDRFGDSRVEVILRDMFCIRVEKKVEIFSFLEVFNNAIDRFFPEFKKFIEGPIQLSLVHCRSKFPFFEVWRTMEEQTGDLRISLAGHGVVDSSQRYLDDILLAATSSYRRSALHKLAEISRISEKLAELKFQDRSEKSDFESYETLRRRLLPLGMDFSSLLTFTKLLGD